MGFDVGFGQAFVYGILSFISPCILPIVPPYLCFLAGVSFDELTAADKPAVARGRIVLTAVAFVLGFGTIFVLFGATASALGQLVADNARWLTWAAGVIIILFGLHFLGIFRIGLLYRQARADVVRKPPGFLGALVAGLAFGFGWTPCVGPILTTILFMAADRDSVGEGMALLAAYAAGIGVPFVLAAVFVGAFLGAMKGLRRYMGTVEKVMGGMLVLTGILFLTGGLSEISYWLYQFEVFRGVG